MALWNYNDVNKLKNDSKGVDTALSAYEEAMIENMLKERDAEKLQAQVANDVEAGSLRYLFRIFR